jgi:hypothetical protein
MVRWWDGGMVGWCMWLVNLLVAGSGVDDDLIWFWWGFDAKLVVWLIRFSLKWKI